MALKDRGEIPASLPYFQQALEEPNMEPDERSAILNDYGISLAMNGDVRQSIVMFKKALELRKDAKTHYNLGNSYMRLGELELAERALEIAHSMDELYQSPYLPLAELLERRGERERAIRLRAQFENIASPSSSNGRP